MRAINALSSVSSGHTRYRNWQQLAGPAARYLSCGVILAVIAQRLLVADTQIDWDEESYFTTARLWSHGVIPYRDIFDIKPPFIFVFYLIASLGGGFFWIRSVVTCLLIVSNLVMFRALQRRALIDAQYVLPLAAALCCVVSTGAGAGTNLELVYMPFEMLSFSQLLNKRPWTGGVYAALVISIKYTAIMDIAGLGIAYWVLSDGDKIRTQCCRIWIALSIVLSLTQFAIFYAYFLRHGVSLLHEVIGRDLAHAATSQASLLTADPRLIPFLTLVAIVAVSVVLICGFKEKASALFRAVWPWLMLSIVQALITRQYYYHYFLPVLIPLFLIPADFRTYSVRLLLLVVAMFVLEGDHVIYSYHWRGEYERTKVAYLGACGSINDHGYVLAEFLAAYRVCDTRSVDKFMFPALYFSEHFIALSGSGGMQVLRSKFENGELRTIVSTPHIWRELGWPIKTVNEASGSRVILIPDTPPK